MSQILHNITQWAEGLRAFGNCCAVETVVERPATGHAGSVRTQGLHVFHRFHHAWKLAARREY